jgi:hypothetical protein
MNYFRLWLFRGLVIATAGLMIFSFNQMWWSASIPILDREGANIVRIYPFGLSHSVPVEYHKYLAGSEMPAFFTPLMWIYLGLCIAALLFSLWAKDRDVRLWRIKFNLPKLIIGLVGFSYMVVVVLAVVVAAIRTGDFFNMHLLGSTYITLGAPLEGWAYGNLKFGYWLACAVGPLLIVLSLLRNRIVGKPKLNM